MIDEKYITGIVNEIISQTEIFLVEIRISSGRILIAVDKPSGVTIDECASVSRQITSLIEESGIEDNYELEVGSPGMDQPLKVYNQYLRRIGKRFRVLTSDGGIHNGILKSADENCIHLQESFTVKEGKTKIKKEEIKSYAYTDIKQAKFEFSISKEKG